MITHKAYFAGDVGYRKLTVREEHGLCAVLVDQYGSHWLYNSDGFYHRIAVGEATLDDKVTIDNETRRPK